MSVAQYKTASKAGAISFIIDAMNRKGKTPERIFTLPSMTAGCAKRFRREWPSSHIAGLDKELPVLQLSPCLIGSGNSPDEEVLNVLIGGVLLGKYIEHGKAYTRKKNHSGKAGRRFYDFGSVDIGKFDLIFLDYTCVPSNFNADEVKNFAARHANPDAVVAVTLTMSSGKIQDNERNAKKELEHLKKLRYPAFSDYHMYGNSNSNMCVAIWEV